MWRNLGGPTQRTKQPRGGAGGNLAKPLRTIPNPDEATYYPLSASTVRGRRQQGHGRRGGDNGNDEATEAEEQEEEEDSDQMRRSPAATTAYPQTISLQTLLRSRTKNGP